MMYVYLPLFSCTSSMIVDSDGHIYRLQRCLDGVTKISLMTKLIQVTKKVLATPTPIRKF
jgi:hypothetical protein